jgi:hypothetical protein
LLASGTEPIIGEYATLWLSLGIVSPVVCSYSSACAG